MWPVFLFLNSTLEVVLGQSVEAFFRTACTQTRGRIGRYLEAVSIGYVITLPHSPHVYLSSEGIRLTPF